MEKHLIDIHSHLADKQFDADREAVLQRMQMQGVSTITVGTDFETSKQCVALAEKEANVFACIGVHPDEMLEGFVEAKFSPLLESKRVVAVGECGLDYFRTPKGEVFEKQKLLFEAQIQFALEHQLPLMLHMRPSKNSLDAYEDALDILESCKKEYGEALRGNSHFFAGDTIIAKRLFDCGFSISFTGVITFTSDYDEVIRYAPLERIHAETDAPYVAPVPFRRERNEPAFVSSVVTRIAELKEIPEDECARVLRVNAHNMFGV